MQSAKFIIGGRVQGVFFRANTKAKADELNIKGWVKNTDDGNVEVLAQGDAGQLSRFEDWCRKGPERARVESFRNETVDGEEFHSFKIIREK